MANIADNLKRLLGTEGNNIQEVLENADSIGGGVGNIPFIEFIAADTTGESGLYTVGEVRGIDNASNYTGPGFIKVVASSLSPFSGVSMLGKAIQNVYSDVPLTMYSYSILVQNNLMLLVFGVGTSDTVESRHLAVPLEDVTPDNSVTPEPPNLDPGNLSDSIPNGGNS